MNDRLFDASEQNEARRPKRRSQKRVWTPRNRQSYQTWTRAELVLADWLLAWAIRRTVNSWQVEAYSDMRKRVRRALIAKDEALLERFLQCQPAIPQDQGVRWPKLWHLFQRTLEREPF